MGNLTPARKIPGLGVSHFPLQLFLRHIVTWLVVTVQLCSCTSNNLVETSPSYLMPVPTVRVYLFSFDRGPLLEITDTPNSDVVLTKAPQYFEAYMFECNATFPIQWSYVGEGAPVMTADVGRQFTNFHDPATYTYHAGMIMFSLLEQNSGRYVCRGIESELQKISTYLHLYVPGSNVLVSTSEKAIQVAPYKDHITLPCTVSDPTAQVNLYKGNHRGVYKRVETNSSITYNPRKGFRVSRKSYRDAMGKYLCVADSSKRRVRINVTPKANYERRKRDHKRTKRQTFENSHYGVEPLQFSYDQRYHRMLCCSASGSAPKLSYAGCTSVVDCEIKSACFREGRCEQREEEGDIASYYNKYIGLDPKGCTGHSLRTDPNGDRGLFLCQDTSTPAMLYQPFQLNRGNLFMNFQEAPPADHVMTLDRATSEELFVGSETMFRCNSSRFFFGFGVRWAFERMNGDLDFVPDADVANDLYFLNNHRRHTTLRIPDFNIKSVVCAAPVWNSPTEWRMLSLPVSVSLMVRPPPKSAPSRAEYLVSPQQYEPTQELVEYPKETDHVNDYPRSRQRHLLIPAVPAPELPATNEEPFTPILPATQTTYAFPENVILQPKTEYENSPRQLYYETYAPDDAVVGNPEGAAVGQTSIQYYYSGLGSNRRARRRLKKTDRQQN